MADCECLPKCPFFNDRLENMPNISVMIKQLYCRDKYCECARYMVFKALGRENVPADLFPPDTARAKEIIPKK